ncbi:hypothetical protein BH20ACT2_BH20ACT2_23640 [soil metagenome]
MSPDQTSDDEEVPAPGMPDLGGLLAQAQQMQEQLQAAQAAAAETVIEAASGGGVVKIQLTGAMEFRSVTIDPAAVDPDDVEMLEDLVLAALHDAMAEVAALQQTSMGGFDLGGLELGGLGGALGGGQP